MTQRLGCGRMLATDSSPFPLSFCPIVLRRARRLRRVTARMPAGQKCGACGTRTRRTCWRRAFIPRSPPSAWRTARWDHARPPQPCSAKDAEGGGHQGRHADVGYFIGKSAPGRNPVAERVPSRSEMESKSLTGNEKRRVSSAVEQRFCKPLVGSSILSPGTAFPPGPRGHPWAIEDREPSQVAIQAQFRRLTARRWQVGKASGTGVPS